MGVGGLGVLRGRRRHGHNARSVRHPDLVCYGPCPLGRRIPAALRHRWHAGTGTPQHGHLLDGILQLDPQRSQSLATSSGYLISHAKSAHETRSI